MPLKEGTLGIGISLKKSPRTGLCMYVNPTIDLMNMRSFTKLRVRKALAGEKFSHWLPLYFGEDEIFTIQSKNYDHTTGEMVVSTQTVNTKERFETHITNTLSFLTNGSTKKPFTGEQAMTIMLKLIGTHIVDMMKENRHVSIIAIRRVFNFIRLFIYLISKDDSIQKLMHNKVDQFMASSENRHKNICQNLLDFQIMAIMSGKIKFEEFVKIYCDE